MNTQDKNIINGNCWVACCDILGFKKEISEFEKVGVGHLDVFFNNYYKSILDELQSQGNCYPNDVFIAWFSDTFLFFTRDDSKNSFGCLCGEFERFCYSVISQWPIRAAIGFGQLYADTSKNVFLGSGLINAYKYAEKQNWIGLVVTPEANKRTGELGIDLSRWRSRFRKYPVPLRQQEGMGDTSESELFVSRIHRWPLVIEAVKNMQREAMNDKDYETKYKAKYENTLKFFERCPSPSVNSVSSVAK
jgi:hypothetical protein